MTIAPAPSCLVVAERRSESVTPAQAFPLGAMGLAHALDPGKDLERDAAMRVASMIDTARRGCLGSGWLEMVILGLLLACQTAAAPSSAEPSSTDPSGVVRPASDERSAAGAATSMPGGGGADAELNGGIGGNAARPAGSGASGMGGNDTGSGGAAGEGASGGSSGASGRDSDPSSGDEQRYALWLGPAESAGAGRAGAQAPNE
jgi:hypothetical protein